MQNPFTQIVLPCGQNEVVMSGKLEDCKNSIFLNILDVDDINYIIRVRYIYFPESYKKMHYVLPWLVY